ncbi:serine hydrolase [soil metagenome]
MRYTKKLIYTFLCLFFINSAIFSQQAPDPRLEGMEKYIQKALTDFNVPGVGISIVQKGKVVYSGGFGYRDVSKKLPVTENTIFAIGSCTKAFTSTAIGMLVDKGMLEFDTPVITYIPDFKLFDDYATRNVTLRDMMSHRTGLPRHDLVWYGNPTASREDLFKLLRYMEPSKPFRTTWQYNNFMFMAAGYIIEKMSGKKWEDYVKDNIFSPLGMNDTYFYYNDFRSNPETAVPYGEEVVDKKANLKVMPFRDIMAIGPAGSINSSANDMAKWVTLQLNGGTYENKKIVSFSSINKLQSPSMIINSAPNENVGYQQYGMGWVITNYRNHIRVEHGGNIDGFTASVCLLPMDSIGIVVLTNKNETTITSVIRNYLIDKMTGLSEIDWEAKLVPDYKGRIETANDPPDTHDRVEGTKPSHELKDFAGTFMHPAYGKVTITSNDDNLAVKFNDIAFPLEHYHYDVFFINNESDFKGMKFTFFTSTEGKIDKVNIPLEPAINPIEFKRVPEVSTTTADLIKFEGLFELSGMTLTVTLKGKSLWLNVPGQPEYELDPVSENKYEIKTLPGYSVSFDQDNNIVTAIVLHQPNGVFTAKKKA